MRRRPGNDEALCAALVAGHSWAEAAELAGIAEKTAQRRAKEPELQQRMSAMRGDMLKAVSANLSQAGGEAAARLRELVHSDSERIALDATTRLLDTMSKLHASVELEARLEALERRLVADGRPSP